MEERSHESNQISEGEMEELQPEYVVGDCPKENSDLKVEKEIVQEVYENSITESELYNEDKFNLIVFVGNLGAETTIEDVKKLFSLEIGLLDNEVFDVSMLWKVKMDSKELGFTFVEFVSKEAFEKALTLNNSFHFGQSLLVLPSVKTHCGLFHMEKLKPECKKDVKVIETEPKNSTEKDFVPVYKKSDYVAYLKNLPADATKDTVLQFLNFSQNDVIDIHIIKLNQKNQRKPNAKPKKFRAVIAFPSEENLEKCLSQTGRVLQNNCIYINRYVMSKTTSTVDKQTSKSNVFNNVKEKIASSKTRESNAAFEKDSTKTEKVELDLFLKHVNWNVSERHIREFFASVGAKVVGIKQFNDSGAKGRGMGFVSMANKKSLLKGLALNGAIFLGNKIKVCIRSDRKFLASPIEGEAPPIYSTFVAKLPIKISADTLKSALIVYLKQAGFLVESVHVPLAQNHSGNRGYAFVIFQDETSLLNALKLNDKKIHICSCKVNITVSKHWPQNPNESSDAIAKPKEHDYRRVNLSSEQESSRNERLFKRKRKVATSPHRGGISEDYGNSPKRFSLHVSTPVGFAIEQPQPLARDGESYNSEYKAYLDYLEFRDYVSRRKAYDEQQMLSDYHAVHEEQFHQNQKDNQTNFAMTTQSSFVTKPAMSFQDRFQEPEEGNVENGWRKYSSSMSFRDSGGEYVHQTTPVTSAIGYEKLQYIPVPTTAGGYEYLPETVSTTSYSTYEKFPLAASLASTAPISKEKLDLHPLVSYPMNRYGKVTSTGSRYSGGDKDSLQTQWSSSKNANFRDVRDDKESPQEAVYSNDTISRGRKRFNTSERRIDYDLPSTSSLGTTPLSELHSGNLRSKKSDQEAANWVSYPATNAVRSRNYDHYGFSDR